MTVSTGQDPKEALCGSWEAEALCGSREAEAFCGSREAGGYTVEPVCVLSLLRVAVH